MTDDAKLLGERIARMCKRVMIRVMDSVVTNAAQHMVVPGGKESATNASQVTTRSGRLLRALLGAAGRGGKSPESTRSVTTHQGAISGEIEIRVPYAAAHEFGATIPARTFVPTSKQRRFFWAMFYNTNEAKWRGAAMSKSITIPEHAFPARPYIAPGIQDTVGSLSSILADEVRAEFGV
jgi:hypothetical protein